VVVGISADARDAACQRALITQREIARVLAPQHADVAGNARGEHRRADARGFRDDVGAAFHPRAHHQEVAFREQGQGAGMRHAAEPPVAWLARHAAPRFACHVGGEGGTELQHFDIRRKVGEGVGGAERVLFLAQVPEHGNAKCTRGRCMPHGGIGGLVHDGGLAAQSRCKAAQRLNLQHDKAVAELQRVPRLGARGQVAIQVRAGEHDGERRGRMRRAVPLDRCEAAPGVQGDEQVATLAAPLGEYRHAVAGRAQHSRPARRGVPVPAAGAGARRRHDRNPRHAAPL